MSSSEMQGCPFMWAVARSLCSEELSSVIDFSPLSGVITREFSDKFTLADLRAAVTSYYDFIRDLLNDLNDAQVLFEPLDEGADDPYAVKSEDRKIGWSIAHLVLHVTASLEESASVGSMLARGVSMDKTRYRYEPDWRSVTDKATVLARLAESRRMCLAYLDTWPDEPHLDNLRVFDADHYLAKAQINAVGATLGGLRHMNSHVEQLKRVAEQAKAGVAL